MFGENSVETLPGYFIAAEAYVGELCWGNNKFLKLYLEEGRLKKAEELLIGAYWKLSKHNPNEKQANNMTHKGEVLDERWFLVIFKCLTWLENLMHLEEYHIKPLESCI